MGQIWWFAAAHDGELLKLSSRVLERYTNINVTVSDFAEIRKQSATTRSLLGNKMAAIGFLCDMYNLLCLET